MNADPDAGMIELRERWRELRPEGLPEPPSSGAPPRPPGHGLPQGLPSHFLEFLEAWWPYLHGELFRSVRAEDPLWDSVPLILQSGRRAGDGVGPELEGALQFVTFWRRSGELAHPAVTADMMIVGYPTPQVQQRGQSIRDAYLRKPAAWMTRLTLVGFFRQIELLNLIPTPPSKLARTDAPVRPYPPSAWLETFTVVEPPLPVSAWQRVRSFLSGPPTIDQ